MMYVTHSIFPDHTRFVVGEFYANGDVMAVVPGTKEILRVPRFCIETPRLCCAKCGKAALLKVHRHTKKEFAECPDHARHMYETFFAASHDNQRYNRKQRHNMYKQASHWLKKWRATFEARQKRKRENT